MKFIINGRLPGYNELNKGHWAKRHKIKQDAMTDVVSWARVANIKPVKRKVRVEIQCFEPNLKRDDDNVTSGASKVILDALQNCGILQGDGQKYVQCVKHPVQLDRNNPRIEVTITEATP